MIAASAPSRPFSFSEWIFSPTIIASSTTIPMTRRNAKSDITFNDTSFDGRKINVPANAVKIPTAHQNATIGLKNIIRTINTKNNPPKALFEISDILSL